MNPKLIELTCPHCKRKEIFEDTEYIRATTTIKCQRCKEYYDLEGNTK